MDYSNLSRKNLIETIEELEILNKELLKEKENETKLEFSWSGNLGHWYLNFRTGTIVFNPLKVNAIGYTMDELPEKLKYQFFTEKLHPDDYKKTMQSMQDAIDGKAPAYETEYRIRTKDGDWKWFYDRGAITQRDSEGKAIFAAGIVFDITDRKIQEDDLKEKSSQYKLQARTDSLTRIRNRLSIMEELAIRIQQSKEYHSPLSVAMIDIDHFKAVNDHYGHVVGDRVLMYLAGIIDKAIRGIDSVGRYGGEEFLVIMPNTDLTNAMEVCERIRKNVEAFDFGDGIKVTVSLGTVEFNKENAEGFIDAADKCMYEAKESGRNRTVSTRKVIS